MVQWETQVFKYNEDEQKMIGCSVTIYSDEGDLIDKIEIADATKLQELEDALEVIDDTYVNYSDIYDILENVNEQISINATTLNGRSADEFLTRTQAESSSFTPRPHSSMAQLYGTGSTSQYGHVKLRDNLTSSGYVNGEALTGRMGYVLDQKIINVENRIKRNDVRIFVGRSSDNQGEWGKRIQITHGSGDGIYARVTSEDTSYDVSNRNLYFYINNNYYSRDTNANGRTDKLAINLPVGKYLLTVLVGGDGDKNPATEQKIIEVI